MARTLQLKDLSPPPLGSTTALPKTLSVLWPVATRRLPAKSWNSLENVVEDDGETVADLPVADLPVADLPVADDTSNTGYNFFFSK